MTNSRLTYISHIRVVAMLMIVYFHCICCYSGAWPEESAYSANRVPFYQVIGALLSNFHLPIFTLIAGFLYSYLYQQGRYNNKLRFIQGKIKRLIVPYIAVGTFIVFFQDIPVKWMYLGISHLWYLLFLFECFLICTLLNINGFTPPQKMLDNSGKTLKSLQNQEPMLY